MPAGSLATRKINQQNGKTNLRSEMNNPKETPKRPVAIVANPDTQEQSAQPVTRIITNVVRKAIMELYANSRRLVLVEVATEVVPGQEDPEQNNMKKAVSGLDRSPRGTLNKIMRLIVDCTQDLSTYPRSDVVG